MASLTHISLGACGLVGAVPESWASLGALEYVNLGDNPDLEGPLPATWGQLPRLQYLDLSLLGAVRPLLAWPCAGGRARLCSALQRPGTSRCRPPVCEWGQLCVLCRRCGGRQ